MTWLEVVGAVSIGGVCVPMAYRASKLLVAAARWAALPEIRCEATACGYYERVWRWGARARQRRCSRHVK
jgi:hypothetical protein